MMEADISLSSSVIFIILGKGRLGYQYATLYERIKWFTIEFYKKFAAMSLHTE